MQLLTGLWIVRLLYGPYTFLGRGSRPTCKQMHPEDCRRVISWHFRAPSSGEHQYINTYMYIYIYGYRAHRTAAAQILRKISKFVQAHRRDEPNSLSAGQGHRLVHSRLLRSMRSKLFPPPTQRAFRARNFTWLHSIITLCIIPFHFNLSELPPIFFLPFRQHRVTCGRDIFTVLDLSACRSIYRLIVRCISADFGNADQDQ